MSFVRAPRGVLHRAPPVGAFRHPHQPAPPDLAAFVEFFWYVGWDLRGQAPQLQETLPHPNVHLVFERGDTRVFGVQRQRFSRRLEGLGGVFGVKFRPGGFHAFLGRPVAALADAAPTLHEVFGAAAEGVERRVLDAGGEHAMRDVAADFLRSRAPRADMQAERAAAIVDEIAADRALTRVEQVLERHPVSERALQRLFRRYVGATPKWVIGRFRLHEAVEQIAAGRTVDGCEFALALGYFDQAHFIRDFHRLVGRTPAEYERLARPAARTGAY
ncbi:MAG TPA: helix-turn-helix domain-containing protein [Dokdonella sp.]